MFVSQFPLAGELRAQARDWIVQAIFFQFLFGPVTCRVRHGVTPIAISANFQEGRVRFFANRIHNLSNLVAHFAKVHSIDDFAGDIVALRAINNLPQRRRSLHRRAHGKEVVFANENDRQFKQRGQIQRFVKRALIDCAVAKETERHAVFAPVFNGKSHSNGQRHMSSDNGMATVHVILLVEKMH